MLRSRFDAIRIIDFHGDNRGALPATIAEDHNIFNIEVGVCVLIAYATGEKVEGTEAVVSYASVWDRGALTQREKLDLASDIAGGLRLTERTVRRTGMAPLKPAGFSTCDWPGLNEIFRFKSNGIVTYRDRFVYSTTRAGLEQRLRDWFALSDDRTAAQQFKETRDRKAGPARRTQFDDNAITLVLYRPLDRRWLYNRREFIDFPKPELQAAWGNGNSALFCLNDGTGGGPATWCHSQMPDQHAFNNRGGWIFPLVNHDPSGAGHFLAPQLLQNLELAYRQPVTPSETFDAVLALLSATSYTTSYARDLEDDFPHVPFPADIARFERAARIGSRIRALEGFTDEPSGEFRMARIDGESAGAALKVPPPSRAFAGQDGRGAITLVEGTDFRIDNVSQRAWDFAVSGYQVLYKWLKAREGEPTAGAAGVALLRGALDVIARVEELIHCFGEADALLPRDESDTLTRAQLGLGPRTDFPGAQEDEEEDAEAAV